MQLMEYFFYEVWFEPNDRDGIDHETLQAAVATHWLQYSDRAVLAMDGTLVVVGFIQAPDNDSAFEAATGIATDFCRTGLGLVERWRRAMIRDASDHLAFINTGLEPEYQLPALHLQHVAEFTAAAIMRANKPAEAALYRGA